MKREIKYSTQGGRGRQNTSKRERFDVSNSEIACEAIELILVLYTRLEDPKGANSLPVITKVPQLLASISQ